MIVMTVKRLAVRTVPILALLGTLAVSPASLAAVGGPTTAATPAAKPEVPAPPTPASIPVPDIAMRAEEVTALLRDLEPLTAPGPAIEAIQARLPEVSALLGTEMASTNAQLKRDCSASVCPRRFRARCPT